MGRFLNADETDILGANHENLVSENLFAYCGNNPVMNSVPDGRFAFAIPVIAVGAIVLAVVAVSAYFFSTPAGQRSWSGLGRAVYNRFRLWQIAWNRAVNTIRSKIYYAKKGKAASKSGKQRDGTPKNNQAQNKQARDASNKYHLNKQQQRKLHDDISHRNYTYREIEEIARDIKGGR